MSEQPFTQFKEFAETYLEAKTLILFAEEYDPESNSNLQISKELSNALDHLVHAIATKIPGVTDAGDDLQSQLNASMRHLNRAAFDALDGTVISLKENISRELEPYNSDIITNVMPDYWEIRAKLYELDAKVAQNREHKSSAEMAKKAFDKYANEVAWLLDQHKAIVRNVPNFSKRKHEVRQGSILRIVISIISGIIIGVVGAYLISALRGT